MVPATIVLGILGGFHIVCKLFLGCSSCEVTYHLKFTELTPKRVAILASGGLPSCRLQLQPCSNAPSVPEDLISCVSGVFGCVYTPRVLFERTAICSGVRNHGG